MSKTLAPLVRELKGYDEYGYYYTCATPIPFFAEAFNQIRKSAPGGASHAC